MKKSNIIFVILLFGFSDQGCVVNKRIGLVDASVTKNAMMRAMTWQEANPIFAKAPTDWTNGAYYLGVAKAHQSTNDSAYFIALKSMAIRNAWKPWERFYHADDLNICYSYLYLNSMHFPGADIRPTTQIINDHLYRPHPWKQGVVGPKNEKNEPSEKSTLWWWCDALFMAPPVITVYANQLKNDSLLSAMDVYYRQSYDLLYDKKNNLFSRDIRFIWKGDSTDLKEPNGRKIFWSRGNGWVLAGLALILSDLPKEYPNRFFYEDLYLKMAHRIKELQPEDGLWRTSLLCPESYEHGEVSGSGFFTFALAWGINNGLLNRRTYKPVVEKAWKAIMACQKESGKVGWVQNIGANPMPANADSWQNFGTGAFLLAGSEMLKLN
ncbi:MAG: glycoside hydrolase family 105 protein [Chitinophagaceae bacterium]|jgi:unsaturated rhamnogalacturonyl hydrolase